MDNSHIHYSYTSVTEWGGQEMQQLDLVHQEISTRIITLVAPQMQTELHA